MFVFYKLSVLALCNNISYFGVWLLQNSPLGGSTQFRVHFQADISFGDMNKHGHSGGGGDNVPAENKGQQRAEQGTVEGTVEVCEDIQFSSKSTHTSSCCLHCFCRLSFCCSFLWLPVSYSAQHRPHDFPVVVLFHGRHLQFLRECSKF